MVDNNMKLFISKLRKQEGGKIHRNKTEFDITTSCGIYRFQHEDAEIFKYIDGVAEAIGITTPSTSWTKDDLDEINKMIDSELEDQYSAEFYQSYFKSIDLNKLCRNLVWPYASIFITGNKLANKALQYSTNTMMKLYPSLINPNYDRKDLKVDGIIGNSSRELIYSISDVVNRGDKLYGDVWKCLFINYCKTFYIEIATSDVEATGTDKDIIYLRGWNKRCDNLLGDKDDFR